MATIFYISRHMKRISANAKMPRLEICLVFALATVLSGHLVTEVFHLTSEALYRHLSTLSQLREFHNDSRIVQHIKDTFTDIATMDSLGRSVVLLHEFTATTQVRSVNIILLMKGARWGTHLDRLSILGSHFDRIPGTTGINDNGSGMAALFEIARLIAKSEGCQRKNSIILVAFDAEEMGLQGSEAFVNDFLLPSVLEKYNISSDTFHGAYIMDTIMNYDNEGDSQSLPQGLEHLLPNEVEFIKSNNFRGNFLAAIGRETDRELLELFVWHWNYSRTFSNNDELTYNILPIEMSRLLLSHAPDLLRSDHVNFWAYNGRSTTNGLKAVFLTDSGEYRGYMKNCYHKSCDDMRHVTPERLQFLAITTHTLKTLLLEVSAENKHCYREIHIEYLTESSASGMDSHCMSLICLLVVAMAPRILECRDRFNNL